MLEDNIKKIPFSQRKAPYDAVKEIWREAFYAGASGKYMSDNDAWEQSVTAFDYEPAGLKDFRTIDELPGMETE